MAGPVSGQLQRRRYIRAIKIAQSLGMSVSDDGIAFTVCGGQLVNGQNAPPEIAAMNGWPVEEVASAIGGRKQ